MLECMVKKTHGFLKRLNENMSKHTQFVSFVINKLEAEGYIIIDKEVITDIVLKGRNVIIDLLVEKDGKLIPVECGRIHPPRQDRILRLKERYGSFLHISYNGFKDTSKKGLKNYPDSLFINAMKPVDEGITCKQVTNKVGCSLGLAQNRLKKLQVSGKINGRKYGNTWLYWSL